MSFIKGSFNAFGAMAALVMAFVLLAATVFGSSLALGKPLGYSPLFILTGSMEPTIHVGALVVSKRVKANSLEPGQIITFPDPKNGSRTLTHRIQHVGRNSQGRLSFITLGDANTKTEEWSMPEGGEVGLYVVDIPGVGEGIQWLSQQPQRMVIFIVLVLFIFLSGMRWAWEIARKEQIKRREEEEASNYQYQMDSSGRLVISKREPTESDDDSQQPSKKRRRRSKVAQEEDQEDDSPPFDQPPSPEEVDKR